MTSPPQEPRQKAWFALRVRTAAEPLACKQIASLGFEHFLPTYASKRRWSDRVKVVQAPLFPGYIFCYVDPNDRLPLLKCSTVVDIVRSGRSPLPVDAQEIDAIRAAVSSDQPLSPYPYLTLGQIVELDRGPLKGLVGILVDDRQGLVLSITLLQRSVVVTIDESWISAASYRKGPPRASSGSPSA